MSNLISQNVMLNLDDVNDVEISCVGDGTYELRAGDNISTFRCYQDLKAFCLNVQSAYEKALKNREYANKVITGVLRAFEAGAK